MSRWKGVRTEVPVPVIFMDVGTLIVMETWPLVSVEVHLLDVNGLVVVVDLAAGKLPPATCGEPAPSANLPMGDATPATSTVEVVVAVRVCVVSCAISQTVLFSAAVGVL